MEYNNCFQTCCRTFEKTTLYCENHLWRYQDYEFWRKIPLFGDKTESKINIVNKQLAADKHLQVITYLGSEVKLFF